MNEEFARRNADVAEQLAKIKIVPVLALESVDGACRLAELLVKHGLNAAEITFRTKEAWEIISVLSKKFPELFIGAGTILNVADLHHAFDAGAKFAVAPGFNPRIVKAAIECVYPFTPGVCTPSEIEGAVASGCRFLKFFPAEAAGGKAMLEAMSAPYKHLGLTFMPTGGINAGNAASYLSLPCVCAVGGTWIGKNSDIEAGDWAGIEQKIIAARELAGI